MIIVSSRKNFHNPDVMSKSGHDIRHVNLETDISFNALDEADLIDLVKDKKVLVLVHGYNNKHEKVFSAYETLEEKVSAKLPGTYDLILGYSWPGGDFALDWWSAQARADSVALMFRDLLQNISSDNGVIDVMSHSLGARVVLKALKDESTEGLVQNYYCTAPAVDNECLEPDEEFHDSISCCKRMFVFHSYRDGVLNVVYRTAEFDRALGLSGPEDRAFVDDQNVPVFVVNCKKHVAKHGGYKHADAMYEYIREYKATDPAKFVTL